MTRKTFNVSVDLWEECIKKARSRGQSLSWVIRRLLEKWLNNELSDL